jgi:nucleotide-binding universal stress UspA family protein
MRIVVATDGSPAAIDAAGRGVRLLANADEITVLSVAEPGLVPLTSAVLSDSASDAVAGATAWDHAEAEARNSVARTAQALRAPPTAVQERVEVGNLAEIICEVARDLRADVIVMGSRGRGLFRQALLGSVSAAVVKHAPCPVLAIRARDD